MSNNGMRLRRTTYNCLRLALLVLASYSILFKLVDRYFFGGQLFFRHATVESLGETRAFRGHLESVTTLDISADGKRLLTGAGRSEVINDVRVVVEDHSIRLWDLQTGEELKRLPGHATEVRAVAFGPDGKRAASLGADWKIRIWDLDRGTELLAIDDGECRASCVRWFADGQRLLRGCGDGTIRVFDLSKERYVLTLGKLIRPVRAMDLSADEQYAVAADSTGSIGIWDLEARTMVRMLDHRRHVMSVRFSPDGKNVLSTAAHSPIILWDTATGRRVRSFEGHAGYEVYCSGFTADGRLFASCGRDRTLRVWNVATGKEERRYDGFPDALNCVAVTRDGSAVVVGGGGGFPGSLDFTVRLWNISDL